MTFSNRLYKDPEILAVHESYMQHPFVKGIEEGNLSKERFTKYLIQDSLYLMDYAKVYAHCFLLAKKVNHLQFLHSCIGVVVADEQNMHTLYLKDANLTMEKAETYPVLEANRRYLDYMLGFAKTNDIVSIFVSALPCTLTYAYIGVELKKRSKCEHNYYQSWIDTYAGQGFEDFRQSSCDLIDELVGTFDDQLYQSLKDIYLEACRHEMEFWNMSYEV